MADREGNVLNPPGFSQGVEVKGTEILGSYSRLTQKGLTILGGSGVLEAGTVLKVSGTPKKYNAGVKAGTGTVGILRDSVDATTKDKLANVVLSGVVKGAAIKASDALAGGLTGAELTTLAGVLGGRYDPVHDYLIF